MKDTDLVRLGSRLAATLDALGEAIAEQLGYAGPPVHVRPARLPASTDSVTTRAARRTTILPGPPSVHRAQSKAAHHRRAVCRDVRTHISHQSH